MGDDVPRTCPRPPDRLDEAEDTARRGARVGSAERWTAFLPFPEALLAEVWVRQGRPDLAAEAFEHAFALGCSVDDACWEAYSVRGLGLLTAAGGDLDGPIELMEEALNRCLRQRDTHRWMRAYVMDALCAVAVEAHTPVPPAWVTDLGVARRPVRACGSSRSAPVGTGA